MHILEAPYVVGGASYTAVPTDNWLSYFTRFLVPLSKLHLPVHRLLYLAGKLLSIPPPDPYMCNNVL